MILPVVILNYLSPLECIVLLMDDIVYSHLECFGRSKCGTCIISFRLIDMTLLGSPCWKVGSEGKTSKMQSAIHMVS